MEVVVRRKKPYDNKKQLDYLSKQIEFLQNQIRSLVKSNYRR